MRTDVVREFDTRRPHRVFLVFLNDRDHLIHLQRVHAGILKRGAGGTHAHAAGMVVGARHHFFLDAEFVANDGFGNTAGRRNLTSALPRLRQINSEAGDKTHFFSSGLAGAMPLAIKPMTSSMTAFSGNFFCHRQ